MGLMIFFHSVMGLPWVVGSTILSVSHVQSLHRYGSSDNPGEAPNFLGVRCVHQLHVHGMPILKITFYSKSDFMNLHVHVHTLYKYNTDLCIQFRKNFMQTINISQKYLYCMYTHFTVRTLPSTESNV